MPKQHNDGLDAYRADAKFLLKKLRKGTPEEARRAVERFSPESDSSDRQLVALMQETMQLKDALDAVAREHGFLEWRSMVSRSERSTQ